MADRIAADIASLAVPLERLHHLPGNPRRGDVPAVAKSLARWGQVKPIVVNKDGTIVAGNHTYDAAVSLGWPDIAVTWVDLPEAEAIGLATADNRTGTLGSFDSEELLAAIDRVKAEGNADLLAAISYSEDAIKELTRAAAFDRRKQGSGDPDDVPEPPAVPVTRPGDLWLLGEHRLLCGDATSEADHRTLLEGETVDLVLTDPPYGVGVDYGEGFADDEASIGALVDGFMPLVLRHKRALLTSGHRVMWRYPPPTWVLAWVHPAANAGGPWGFNTFNPILAYGPDPYLANRLGGRADSLVLTADREGEEGHPVIKPMKFWLWLMERGSPYPDETILDPFCGSGTTIIAAQTLNRRAFGLERSPGFVDVTLARFQRVFGEKPILASTGEPHDFTPESAES